MSAIALLAWVALLRVPLFFIERNIPDEGLYYAIAWRMLDGARIYTDIWDNKPIGIFLIYAAIIRLLGVSRLALDVVSMGTVLIGACGGFLVTRWISQSTRAGLIAAFTLPAYMSDFGAPGANAENFWMIIQVFAVLFLLHGLRAPTTPARLVRLLFAFGLIEGALLQLKFTTMFEAALLACAAAAACYHEHRRFALLVRMGVAFMAGYLFCTALVFAWFAATGGIGDMVFANFVSPRLYVTSPFGMDDPVRTATLFVRRVSYFVLPGIALLWLVIDAWRQGDFGRREFVLPFAVIATWLLGAMLGTLSPGHFMYHYFISLIAPMTILGAWGMERALRRLDARAIWATVAAIAVLVSYPVAQHVVKTRAQLQNPRHDGFEQLADFARSVVPVGSTVFFGDIGPIIYPLSGMRPATRYPMTDAHLFDKPALFGVDPAAEIAAIFARKPVLVVFTAQRLNAPFWYSGVIKRHLEQDYAPIPIAGTNVGDPLVAYRRLEGR